MQHVAGRRAALALMVVVGALVAPVAARAASSAPACKSSQLVAFLGAPNGTAGTVFYKLTFANLGSACTLRGYPGVSAVNHAGRQIGAPAQRQSGTAVKTITLKAATPARWSTASATVGITEALNFPSSSCHPTLAAGLRVFPPNQRTALRVPLPFTTCGSASTKVLRIRAVS